MFDTIFIETFTIKSSFFLKIHIMIYHDMQSDEIVEVEERLNFRIYQDQWVVYCDSTWHAEQGHISGSSELMGNSEIRGLWNWIPKNISFFGYDFDDLVPGGWYQDIQERFNLTLKKQKYTEKHQRIWILFSTILFVVFEYSTLHKLYETIKNQREVRSNLFIN